MRFFIKFRKIVVDEVDINWNYDNGTYDIKKAHLEEKYDYIIGNPPFFKMKSTNKLLNIYRHNAINKATNYVRYLPLFLFPPGNKKRGRSYAFLFISSFD